MTVVRDVATVTVSEPVDGTPRRKARAGRRTLTVRGRAFTVDPRVWAAARDLCGPEQRIVVVSAVEVRVVNA